MVTGTALSHLEALSESYTHDQRYDRLMEYIQIIRLLVSNARPISFEGAFYNVRNLQLYPRAPDSCFPEFLLAGQSDAARRVCRVTNAMGMQMLQSNMTALSSVSRGIHFGLVTRTSAEQAWLNANRLFPADDRGQAILELSMSNTDSVWKSRMKFEAGQPDVTDAGYWLGPFRNFKADCPYFVGSHDRAAELIVGLVRSGADVFVLDVPPTAEEYHNIKIVFDIAKEQLL